MLALAAIFTRTEAATVSDADVAQILGRLDDVLEKRGLYITERSERIDSLMDVLRHRELPVASRLSALLTAGDYLNAFNTDSALMLYETGYSVASRSGLDSVAMRFALRKATYLPLTLRIQRASQLMDSIEAAGVPSGLLAEYYDARRQMCFYMANLFPDQDLAQSMNVLEREAQTMLIPLLRKGTPLYKLNLGESLLYEGDLSGAKATLNSLVDDLDETDPLYARACHMLADIAKERGDENGRIYYLALSAISDARCATREVTSLQELGQLMFGRSDVARAHDYLSVALKNAVDCNVAMRILQTSKAMPYIESAHRAEINASRHRLYAIMAAMGVLVIILVVAWHTVRTKNMQLRGMASRLEQANSTKDVYIAQFLNLCSVYMDKLNQFNKVVNRKLSAGKADDLYKLTKSEKFIEEQAGEFYDVFDNAFLHIYPTFVDEVNNLLAPDKRISLKPGEKLNTDLRILALMRLGIEDTSRIAQMLNYSVYTIYTYRNKFKSRAVDRDNFESDVMKIQSA